MPLLQAVDDAAFMLRVFACTVLCLVCIHSFLQAVDDAARVNSIQLIILAVEGVVLALMAFCAVYFAAHKV